MGLELVPFDPGDLLLFDPSPYARQAGDALGADLTARIARAYAGGGPAWTCFWDGAPVCSAGVVVFGPGAAAGEAWAFLNRPLASRLAPALALTMRRELDRAQGAGLARIQAFIHAENLPGRRLARLLGFHPEALCRKYLARADYMLYARVR